MSRACALRLPAVALGVILAPSWLSAQPLATGTRSATRSDAVAPTLPAGAIQGTVADERGSPLSGVMVSASGASTAFAVTDPSGRFSLRALRPGSYLVRAHLSGFSSPRGLAVSVAPSATATSPIVLTRLAVRPVEPTAAGQPAGEPRVLAAGLLLTGNDQPVAEAPASPAPPSETAPSAPARDDHGETPWRLRHLQRSVLKETTSVLPAPGEAEVPLRPGESWLGAAAMSSARAAGALFDALPFSGEINLLTSGSFDSPEQLFSGEGVPRGIAYVSISRPVGDRADWAMQGAATQGDIASWILSGSYVTRAPASHAYNVGLSYSTQRYNGGNPAALRAVSDGSRNAGAVYAFDRWAIAERVTLGYGARYSRYDYIDGANSLSPRLSLTVTPGERWRFKGLISRRVLAPRAEQFLPPKAGGLWLPPERTFAPLVPDQQFQSERTQHYELALERDLSDTTILGTRTFRQRVGGQLVTLFGVRIPGRAAADLGHYYVANVGSLDTVGWSVNLSHELAHRLRGSVDYTLTTTNWNTGRGTEAIALWAASAVRRDRERLHDVTTSIETEIPRTATRVFVLGRLNTGFARRDGDLDRPGFDARFDVQVIQSLPFMHSSRSQWEMLVALRNFFRETSLDGSPYDELLVVRPPKRLVGGLLLRF